MEVEDPCAGARRCLERGDYGQALGALEPLVSSFPPATPEGAQIQLLMATAWMGQGNAVRAIACCRQVKRCSDATLRAQAKDLLEVLEAPALERPRRWSITLPELGEAESVTGRLQQVARSRRAQRPPPPPAPPVGPTRAPLGFAALVLVLLLLSLLLGGCGSVRAELHFHGPGRLQVGQRLERGPTAVATPWERGVLQALQQAGLRPDGASEPGHDHVLGATMPAAQALELLAANLEDAARLAGVELPVPQLRWQERNWLLGVQQRLSVAVDLRGADPVPGADFSLDLEPLRLAAIRRAGPESVQTIPGTRGVRWPLRLGAENRLELSCWRWSPLGLGAGLILLALGLVAALSRLRQQLGFGLPQLPA
ncbi:DUF3153 domain-containing protein [Cyanobium sp. LEGE 06143]|uniref:DUF3153 domain-containing protein n=1 Tax=Cyanobium sp. LEGE 06143 TaxID=945727 RepID=UPI00187E47BA|nr:DUF3153 domain-containing protein [Cyanobium sp. LEGE 06143]MBE9174044.1 DUF3153 domain-containing protein [Cyanobium sp. LEGE 06143]